MALGKTGASAIAYTPFNKTSFGYGSGEIAAAHSSLTNVKVVLTVKSGANQWDDTGHISTPTSGSAVASYNKDKFEWSCEGSVADVDGVLDALDLFPADYPLIRSHDPATNPTGWKAEPLKANVDDGSYSAENPADTVAIPDTNFDLKVYDPDNSYSLEATYTVTFEPTQPIFGKQRPYWSTEPAAEDANTSAHDDDAGGLLDLGIIAQGSDTDPLTVTCQFRRYETSNSILGTAYGQFTSDDNAFIGNKKPGPRDNDTNRINFTGTKAEVQSYLNNVRYYNNGNELVFDMFFTLSNGVVGSTLTKSVWFSDATIGLTTIPSQRYDEDTAGPWDFGELTTSNIPEDVNNYKAIITVPTAAASNITSSTAGVTQSYTAGTGVYEVSHSSEATLLTALRNITFTPETDYDADFNMTVQLNYTGTTLGSSYTSTLQTVEVEGAGSEELGNPETTHTYVEDTTYFFFNNGSIPQIIHPINDSFTFTFTMNNQAGKLWKTSGGQAIITDVGNGVFTLAGTVDEVNDDLKRLYYTPTPDYFLDHRINFTAVRTSGGGTPPTITGFFDMVGTDVGEFTSTPNVNVVWEEDTNLVFDSGLQIIDEADETVDSPVFGTHYTVSCEMWQPGFATAPDFTDGILKVDDAGRSFTTTTAGSFVIGREYTITSVGDTDFTLIGSADSVVGTVFTATGVGTGTGTADGDSLTITGTGNGNTLFGGSTFTISGIKSEVNKAIQNLKFIPDPDYDGDGPWVWYYIDRNYDGVSLTNVGANENSYDTSLITKFLPASSTEDFFPTSVILDWEENVTKVFDSGLVINDKVTENPEYNTSPTAFYNTTYTVEIAMYGGGVEYTRATLDTATRGSLTISGTGQGDTNKFIMTGSRADLNAALKTMKFIPDVDNVETTYETNLWYTIKRDYDYNASTGVGLLHDQTTEVITKFNTNTATTNITSTPLTGIDWNEYETKDFDSGIVITDNATENQDYGNLFNSTFTVEARAKYTDPSTGDTALNNAIWTTTISGEAAVTGVGTVASPLTITGTKKDVNTALKHLRMAPDIDWTQSDATDGSFWFEYEVTRDNDSITYLSYGTGKSEFNAGTEVEAYVETVSPAMTYNEDTVTKIFEGKTLGITDTSSDYHPDIKYQVELEISPNADGTWNDTGNSIYITAKSTRQSVNADLLTLDFKPTIDSSNNPSILYKQTRYQNFSAGSLVSGTTYTIVSPGDTDFTLIGAANNNVGTVFTATGPSTAGLTGTADIVTVHADGTVDIGTVTGTAVTPYVTSVSGMEFAENIKTSIFSGKTVGITEDVSAYTSDATYTVELKISPSTHGFWDGSTSHIKTLTGTKADVNATIQELVVEPLADTSIDFDILYSQTRHITGSTDVVQATDVNIGTATGINYPEFRYGTANQNIQYFVRREHLHGVDTTDSVSQHDIPFTDVILTPRQISLNKGLPHERPITITDNTANAQYKIVFSGGTMPGGAGNLNVNDTDWGTKEDIHNIIENGLYNSTWGAEFNDISVSAPHNTTYTKNFTLHKKLFTGAESQIASGQLIYKYQSGLQLWSRPTHLQRNAFQLPEGWNGSTAAGWAPIFRDTFYDYRFKLQTTPPFSFPIEQISPQKFSSPLLVILPRNNLYYDFDWEGSWTLKVDRYSPYNVNWSEDDSIHYRGSTLFSLTGAILKYSEFPSTGTIWTNYGVAIRVHYFGDKSSDGLG